jgi:predicted transcriptional regulator
MGTAVLTIRVREELKAKLDRLAQATQRSKSFLAEEAIARYLDVEAWQIGEIAQAIEEANKGDFAEPAELQALLKKYAG